MIRNRMTVILVCVTVVQLILLFAINFLASENSQLKKTIEIMVSNRNMPNGTSSQGSHEVLRNKKNANPRKFIPSEVTILLLKRPDMTLMFERKLEKIKRLFPSSPLKWDDKPGNVAKTLNRMVKEIQTEYFMVLEAEVSFSEKPNEGIDALWDALERYPEIDFIGGSYLSDNKLYVACQRYRFCRWTFSESYEYKRSRDNIMICEGTSASYMGRTKSIPKIQNGFDENISDILLMKDFFIRAKATSVVVATRPSFILLLDGYQSLYEKWQSGDISKDLISFAVKYKVFNFKDENQNSINLCSSTSPLSGKDICIEKNSHKHMLNNGHWAYQGLYTYPYLLEYLIVSLREVTNFLEQHNVNYVLRGGVSLGAIKMHSILPWDAGDVDIDVYGMTIPQLMSIFKPWTTEKGYVLREHTQSKAVHVYCTPKELGDVAGGLASLFINPGPPPKYIQIKTNGIWVRYRRNLFEATMSFYGQEYLSHKLYQSEKIAKCKIKGHNACLPNFNSIFNGKGGTYREYFCEI